MVKKKYTIFNKSMIIRFAKKITSLWNFFYVNGYFFKIIDMVSIVLIKPLFINTFRLLEEGKKNIPFFGSTCDHCLWSKKYTFTTTVVKKIYLFY